MGSRTPKDGAPKFCVNCSASHSPWDRTCPCWLREKKIRELQVTRDIPLREARRLYGSLNPNSGPDPTLTSRLSPIKPASIGKPSAVTPHCLPSAQIKAPGTAFLVTPSRTSTTHMAPGYSKHSSIPTKSPLPNSSQPVSFPLKSSVSDCPITKSPLLSNSQPSPEPDSSIFKFSSFPQMIITNPSLNKVYSFPSTS